MLHTKTLTTETLSPNGDNPGTARQGTPVLAYGARECKVTELFPSFTLCLRVSVVQEIVQDVLDQDRNNVIA
jgi:hypothetical protein